MHDVRRRTHICAVCGLENISARVEDNVLFVLRGKSALPRAFLRETGDTEATDSYIIY